MHGFGQTLYDLGSVTYMKKVEIRMSYRDKLHLIQRKTMHPRNVWVLS